MRVGSQLTNPGQLRTPVLFQNPAIVSDAGGAQKASWSDLDTVYVKWINEHGQEAVQSEALEARKRATVLRRYNALVTEKTTIVKDGERWQVVSVDDIQNRHEYMELVVQLTKGSV